MPEQLSDVELRILGAAYTLRFEKFEELDVPKWLASNGLDLEYPKCVGPASRAGLAAFYDWDTRKTAELNVSGVIHVERWGLAEPSLIARMQQARKRILSVAVDSGADFFDLVSFNHSDVGLTFMQTHLTGWFMERMGWIHHRGHFPEKGPEAFCVCLTPAGKDQHELWEAEAKIEARWRELQACTDMTPQRRGKELEKLLEELAGFQGIDVARSAPAPGEENDLIFTFDFHIFIVSCKWEQDPAKAEYVRSLRARLATRPGSYGLLVSGGGISGDAKTVAQTQTSSGLVVLFGQGDLDRLFTLGVGLEDLLKARHKRLAINFIADYE